MAKDTLRARFIRHVHDVADTMIEQARSGEHPDVAVLLLRYFVWQVRNLAPVDPRVNAYIADALAEAIRRLPAGSNASSTDAFIMLGLVRAKGGRPRGSGLTSGRDGRAEMDQDIARMLAAGRKQIDIKSDLAGRYDCSEETVGNRLREIVDRASQAVAATEQAVVEPSEAANTSGDAVLNEQTIVGKWLDPTDCHALELGVERQVVEIIGRRRLTRRTLGS